MSRYEVLNTELSRLRTRQAVALAGPAMAAAFLVYAAATPPSFAMSVIAVVVTFVFSLLLFHRIWKVLFRPYKQWSERSAHISGEIAKLRHKVALIFEKYREREKGEHFKKAYDLAGKSLRELEEALSVGMHRESREIFVTAFIHRGIAVRVTASIGSPYRCAPADNPGDWKKHIDRLTCDEIRQYHNHPAHNGTTRPSSQDFRTTQTLRSLLGSHGTKLRSLIICWNSICEWKIFEYDESGKYWLCSEFDAAA